MNKLWRIWKYAIGSFSDEQTKEFDDVVAMCAALFERSAQCNIIRVTPCWTTC